MTAMWFGLAAIALMGAVALLYVDRSKRDQSGRVRQMWAKAQGYEYRPHDRELVTRFSRAALSKPEFDVALGVVTGVRRGEEFVLFDVEETGTIVAVQRSVGSDVDIDLRPRSTPPPRDEDMELLGSIGRVWCSPPTSISLGASATSGWLRSPSPSRRICSCCGARRTGRWDLCRSAVPVAIGMPRSTRSRDCRACCMCCPRCAEALSTALAPAIPAVIGAIPVDHWCRRRTLSRRACRRIPSLAWRNLVSRRFEARSRVLPSREPLRPRRPSRGFVHLG